MVLNAAWLQSDLGVLTKAMCHELFIPGIIQGGRWDAACLPLGSWYPRADKWVKHRISVTARRSTLNSALVRWPGALFKLFQSRNQHACEVILAYFIYNYFKAEPLSGELIVQFLKEKVDIFNLLQSIETHPDNTVVIYFTFFQKIFYILNCYLYQCILTS